MSARRPTVRSLVVPAGAFSPASEDLAFTNQGYALYLDLGYGSLMAPLIFEQPEVTIKRITLYSEDGSWMAAVCVSLMRTNPRERNEVMMGQVCSSQGWEVVSTTAIGPGRITGDFGAYLKLTLGGTYADSLRFFAVRIVYSY